MTIYPFTVDSHAPTLDYPQAPLVRTPWPEQLSDNSFRVRVDWADSVEHVSQFDSGGHFPVLGVPDLFVDDVRAFFRRLR